MHALKLKAGNTVTWRSIEWKVSSTDKDTYELRPRKPEIAAIIGPIKFKREIELPSSPTLTIGKTDLGIPGSLDPKDWDPTHLRWNFLINSRFQSTEVQKLLWSTAVPIQRLNRQLLPAFHAINQKTPRLLIADDVGLGKTTEAGILISELLARKWAERILVIAPAHLAQRKWETELNKRFGLCFDRIDSSNFLNVHENKLLSSDENPFKYTDRLILSLDYAKEPHIRRRLEEAEWDLVVFDECHRIANRASHENSKRLRYLLADKLSARAKGIILISGTPHDGDDNSFESLINLLSRKSDKVPSPPKPVLVRRLRSELSPEEALLSPEPTFEMYDPSEEWLRTAELLSNLIVALKREKIVGADLFQVMAFKRFLSAPESLRRTLGLENESETNTQKEVRTRLIVEAAEEKPILKAFLQQLDKVLSELSKTDPKKHWLKDYIKKTPSDDRLIIFTEFEDTAHSLEPLVRAIGRPVFVVSGSDHKDINKTLAAFNRKKGAVLITTDTLSEGVDLQDNCHRLLHYDLPFRPYRIEQRNGRIDRMGQKKKPYITMVVPNEQKLASINNTIATKALSVARLYEHLSRQKEKLGSIVPVLESLKSLRGKSEMTFFMNLHEIESEIKLFEIEPQHSPQEPETITVGSHTYTLDRRSSVPDLKWTGQSDLGLHPNLIQKTGHLYKKLETYLRDGVGEAVTIDEFGECSREATKEILPDLYSTLDMESALQNGAWSLVIGKDCVNEKNSECMTWGHGIWEFLTVANAYAISQDTNVALSPIKSEFPIAVACWNSNRGVIVLSALFEDKIWKPTSENQALTFLSEEIASIDGPRSRAVPEKKDETQIIAAYALLENISKQIDGSAEFLGLIYRPNRGGK